MFSSKNQFLTGAGGYQISRSVRLRSSASAYLNRTPASAGNRTTWTWSGWAKLGSGLLLYPLDAGAGTGIGVDVERIQFGTGNGLYWQRAIIQTSTTYQLQSSAVFRDPSAWYHLVLVWDSSNATSTERMRAYVNGVRLTTSAYTAPSQNQNSLVNASTPHKINTNDDTSTSYGDGYLTEIHFIDGQALTPSSFGQNDPVTGVWEPIKYAGTYGTNGFYLNFSDNSAATATTIGKDNSGNGNNWTPNNISVTAGTTYDSMLDVPTLYADGGNGRGNYCTMNAVNKSSNTTLSAGNLNLKSTTTGWSDAAGTIGVSSGKWYWEVTVVSGISGVEEARCGILKDGFALPVTGGLNAGSYVYSNNGNKYNNSTGVAYGATFTNGDIIGVALDLDAGTLAFYKNNTSQGTAYSGLSGVYFPDISQSSNPLQTANFGQQPFTYTPPTGFVALNTQNLPTPTISKGNQYFDVLTYTGNSTNNRQLTGLAFQPDFMWCKNRGNANDHQLYDAVRGVTKSLSSNTTNAEATLAELTSFNSDGVTLGTWDNRMNGPYSYVDWFWNAGGSTVTNTSGTISAQVRANATAGFSVVTYTGTGANATVGHGLGVAPKMIIVKNRSAVSQQWMIAVDYSGFTWSSDYFQFDTGAKYTNGASTIFRQAPTSTVFSVGTNSNINGSTNNLVAYCFSAVAGYSAFGSYTGNGSTDGPFVYCGFKPRWVMVKRTDSAGYGWIALDTARNTYNVVDLNLNPNDSVAEFTTTTLDILSNGFKLRTTDLGRNASGGTYIYAAFAENPFKISLAR